MRWERLSLILALFCLFIHISRRGIISFTGVDVTPAFSVFGIFFFALAVLRYRRAHPVPPAPTSYVLLIAMFLLYVALLGPYGYFRGHIFTSMAQEALVYGLIVLLLLGGRHDQLWRDIQFPGLVVFWVGFVIVCATLNRPTVEIGLEGITTGAEVKDYQFRSEVTSLGYDLQPYLSLWPILFAVAYQSRTTNWRRLLGLATAPAFLALSIIFLKRAPVARALTYIFVILLASGILQGQLRVRTAVVSIVGILLGCMVVGGVYLTNLKQRYETGEREARVSEAQALLEDIHGLEWVFGKGLGGYFEPPPGWKAGLTYVNYAGEKGRTNVHIGILMPLLKGGIIFMTLYYLFFFRVMWFKPRRWNLYDINFAARTVLPVYMLFLLIEGPPSLTDPFSAVLVGLCCARGSVDAYDDAAIHELPLGGDYDYYAAQEFTAANDQRWLSA